MAFESDSLFDNDEQVDVTPRSSSALVRNPVLQLSSAALLQQLPPEAKAALKAVLMEIRANSQDTAEKCWRKHKAPMAAYWKAVSVYAGHIARVLR
jgi:hypothetical protein